MIINTLLTLHFGATTVRSMQVRDWSCALLFSVVFFCVLKCMWSVLILNTLLTLHFGVTTMRCMHVRAMRMCNV
jgi:hypothetical protein